MHTSILSPKQNDFTVTIIFDGKQGRESKQFDGMLKAKKFYVAKSMAGKNPELQVNRKGCENG